MIAVIIHLITLPWEISLLPTWHRCMVTAYELSGFTQLCYSRVV